MELIEWRLKHDTRRLQTTKSTAFFSFLSSSGRKLWKDQSSDVPVFKPSETFHETEHAVTQSRKKVANVFCNIKFVCRSISLPIRDVSIVSINTPFHDLHGIVVSHARLSACVYSFALNFYSIAVEILDKATSSNTPWSWAKIHGFLRTLLSYLPAEMRSVNQTD